MTMTMTITTTQPTWTEVHKAWDAWNKAHQPGPVQLPPILLSHPGIACLRGGNGTGPVPIHSVARSLALNHAWSTYKAALQRAGALGAHHGEGS